MRYVLTGCGGFIGSNLSRYLVTLGHEVIGIDNLSTGFIENVDPERFKGLAGTFRFIKKDINDEDLYETFKEADYCLHLAALAKVQFSTDFPLLANHANIDGTLNVLEASRKAGVKRVVFSSSSSVYGGANIHFPTPETESLYPRSHYAFQKQAGENYCRLYSELYGLDTVCLRYFNVTGINSRLGGAYSALIPVIMNAAVNGGVVNINGDGEIYRDYTPVENVVSAITLAAEHPGRLNGECFNVALGQTFSINEVYNKVCDLAGFKISKTHGPERLGDPKKSLADITKIKAILGYEPLMSFSESLDKTYQWWKGGCKI